MRPPFRAASLRAALILLALFSAVVPPPRAGADSDVVPDSVDIVPGAIYGAQMLTRPIRGAGHRDLWTDTIRVAVANLERTAGGLVPLYSSPLEVTHVLYLRGDDGQLYAFWAVRKDFSSLVPEDLRATRYERVLNDIAAAMHPTGFLVLPDLTDAVGVLHTSAELRQVWDTPRLGSYRSMFADQLVLMTTEPEGKVEGGFAGATDVIEKAALVQRMHRGEATPDAETYLRARLLDMVIGDRGRDPKAWQWAFGTNDSGLWQPIPVRRFQAFMDVSGIWRVVLGLYQPGFTAYKAKKPPVQALMTRSYDIDRLILPVVPKPRWDAITEGVQQALTDEVIETAVRKLPAAHYRRSGKDLIKALKARRDLLGEASRDFFRNVTRYTDIDFTDGDDEIIVEYQGEGGVRVAARQAGGGPYLDRRFESENTKEVRLYLRAGDDRLRIQGESHGRMQVRISAGAGNDSIVVDSGSLAEGATVYGPDSSTVVAGDVKHKPQNARRRILWAGGLQPATHPDWGSRTYPRFDFSVGADFGFRPRVELYYDKMAFLEPDYKNRSMIALRYSTRRNTGSFKLEHLRRNVAPRVHFYSSLFGSRIERIRYFGIGNETKNNQDGEFYDLQHGEIRLDVGIGFGSEERFLWKVTAMASHADTDTSASLGTLISIDRPYGSGEFNMFALTTEMLMDRRDDFDRPTAGYLLEAGAGIYPEAGDLKEGTFADVWGRFRGYLPLYRNNPILAGRGYVGWTFGDAPFMRQPWLGGEDILRAYRENRFLGEGAIAASLELRVALFSLPILFVPVDFGMLGFGDVGRVFAEDENSNTLHTSGGIGLFMAPGHLGVPALEDLLLRLYGAWSSEQFNVYFGFGVTF